MTNLLFFAAILLTVLSFSLHLILATLNADVKAQPLVQLNAAHEVSVLLALFAAFLLLAAEVGI